MKPTWVVLAIGCGYCAGKLEQLDSVDPAGEPILDYSPGDARRRGFERAVFFRRRTLKKACRVLRPGTRWSAIARDADELRATAAIREPIASGRCSAEAPATSSARVS